MKRFAQKKLLMGALFGATLLASSCILSPNITLTLSDRYDSGLGEGAAEIVSYDKITKKLFVVNAEQTSVDVLSVDAQGKMQAQASINLAQYRPENVADSSANSVAASHGLIAVAVEYSDEQDYQMLGSVLVFNADTLELLGEYQAGYLPDMVTFTPNGNSILVANEGEPSDDYSFDPEGSITRIDLDMADYSQSLVTQIDFQDFNEGGTRAASIDRGVRIFGEYNGVKSSVAQDLEPEYITIDDKGETAWISLQENNAIAVLDLNKNRINRIRSLGYKNYRNKNNAIDTSDKDDAFQLRQPANVLGMYQPDAIASFRAHNGETYVLTANEGDARDYDGFSEEVRVKDLILDERFPADAIDNENLGRLKTTTSQGDLDGDGDIDRIFSYGARSFSILKANGKRVYDSGNEFVKEVVANIGEEAFVEGNQLDGRSDDKGVEPESVVVGQVGLRHFAFIGLERASGIMVYDVTVPEEATFVDYITTEGDISPEGMAFIPAIDSPTKKPMLAVSYEISGTTTLFEISQP